MRRGLAVDRGDHAEPGVGGLIERGFTLLGLWENADGADPDAEPGSWDHFCSVAPPYLELWARLDGRDEPR